MEPNNTPPTESNPYDFILNSKSSKKSIINFKDKKSFLLILVVLLLIVTILLVIIKNLLAGPNIINITSYNKVLANQQEIIHLTSEVNNGTFGNLTLPNNLTNATITTNLSIISQQTATELYLKLNGYNINQAQINSEINLSLDNQLKSDYQNNNFTNNYQQALQNNLNSYLNSLSNAYKLSSGKHGRNMLNSDYKEVLLLVKLLKS